MTYKEKNLKSRTEIEKYVLPENQTGTAHEELSPSGRFKLLIRFYSTQTGSWSVSRGTVTRVSDGTEVCDIIRNYGFTYSWVTKGEHEYLISGRSYMSQTIVNLDTGVEMEPEGKHYDSYAFCWADATLVDNNTLLVDGCHWACPYEFRFYDFSDPETLGWPELSVLSLKDYEEHKDDLYDEKGELRCLQELLEADAVAPVKNPDGTYTVVKTSKVYKATGQSEYEISLEEMEVIGDEQYNNEENWHQVVNIRHTLERRGNVMVITETWKSEKQKQKEAAQKAYQEKQDADFKHWSETDEYLKMLRLTLAEHPTLMPFKKTGWVSSSGKAREEGEKNHWFFYSEVQSKTPLPQWTYSDEEDDPDPCMHDPRQGFLKWGTIAGDTVSAELQTVTPQDGTQRKSLVFPKTQEGMLEALQAIQEHLHSECPLVFEED
jgi:hypothetical protein